MVTTAPPPRRQPVERVACEAEGRVDDLGGGGRDVALGPEIGVAPVRGVRPVHEASAR